MTSETLALFPLNTVLFPDGPLPLRIFEPRYVDMISRCMKNDQPFGVVLIADGPEAAGAVRTQAQGTLAHIRDFSQEGDGLLGILAQGGERFRLLSMDQQQDGLNVGTIEQLPREPTVPLPGEFTAMAKILRAVMEDLGDLYAGIEPQYDDASWVGYRMAEIMPINMEHKQLCLEMDDPLERLEYLRPFLREPADA